MTSTAVLEAPVLVLNRHWVPIHLTTSRHALTLLFQRVARAVHPIDCSLHRFQSWSDLRLPQDFPQIHTVSLSIPVPEIVVLERYGHVPRRRVPFNRRNLFNRDACRCQYCGVKDEPRDLTIDHVNPRSKGGLSSWKNCVVACVPCNRRKGRRAPEEVNMSLIREPRAPRWTPRHLLSSLPRRATWERVIGDAYWNAELDA